MISQDQRAEIEVAVKDIVLAEMKGIPQQFSAPQNLLRPKLKQVIDKIKTAAMARGVPRFLATPKVTGHWKVGKPATYKVIVSHNLLGSVEVNVPLGVAS